MTVDLMELAGLDAPMRAHLLDTLSRLPAREEPRPGLTTALRVVRDALRERYPIRADRVLVDVLCRLDPHHWSVEGWSAQQDAELFALTPEGEAVELEAVIDAAGRFEAVASTRSPSTTEGWVVMSSAGGGFVETPELSAMTSEQVLADVRVLRFGPALPEPQGAIVVSLDSQAELLEHHLVWLETEKWRDVELVCVLDGPADLARARCLVEQLHDLYGRPLTLVVLPVLAGRLMMRAAGAAQAIAADIAWSDWPGRFA